ncbi:MAG: glycosyltransferase family 2 protein [Candidatus Omnitrophica bacterium]|nr:glycosyltransferase family 2 protein [Candidatus Omnitrophota bacterium]
MEIKLSFCIPTYNFGDFLGETLESIISQAGDSVEIVIVDSASTDNTREVVGNFQKRFSRIRYCLREKRMDVDTDIAKAVELAQGRYCWLMSSDDKIKPHAVGRMIKELDLDNDIYLCNRTECNFMMEPIRDRLWLSKETGDSVFELSQRGQLMDYLVRTHSIGALFSYCSSLIFKRAKWDSLGYNNEFSGTGYAHVFRLFSFRKSGCSLKYVKEPLVLCRGDNDSFLSGGKIKRFLLDIDGYRLLASRLFAEEPEIKKAFLKVMTKEMRPHYIMEIRSLVNDEAEWAQIKSKLKEFGFRNLVIRIAEALGSAKLIAPVGIRLKEEIKKRRYRDAPNPP